VDYVKTQVTENAKLKSHDGSSLIIKRCMDTITFVKEIPMMNMRKIVIALLAMGVLLVGMSGCQQGPMERAGKKIDKTVEKGGDQIEKAGEKIKEEAKGK
jgi:hypothetical protein